MKKMLIMMVLGLISLAHFAQSPIWIADQNNGGYLGSTGFYGYYNYSRAQHIYTNTEVTAGKINSVALYIDHYTWGAKFGSIDNVSIKMTHVNYNSFASATYEETALTTVYTGTISPNGQTGWYKIELNTPFEYNGTDNLLIEFLSEDGSYYNNCEPHWSYTNQTTVGQEYKTVKGYSDYDNPPLTQFQSTNRADIILGYEHDNIINGAELLGDDNGYYNKSVLANGYYNYSHVQHIYKSTELHAGTIDQLSFYIGNYYNNLDYGKIDSVTFQLTHVTNNSFQTATYFAGTLSKVWTGEIIPNGQGWYTIHLDSNFIYNGIDNLLIDVISSDGSWSNNSSPEFSYTNQTTIGEEYKTIKDYSDYLPLNTPFLSTQRADIIIGFKSDLVLAEEITIGNQTGSNQFNVVEGYYGYSKMQYIYKASELQQGDISRVGFNIAGYKNGADYGSIDNVALRMGHIVENTFATPTFAVDTIFDTVWVGNLILHDRGWHYIDLDTPFKYNGTDNLILEIISNDGSYWDNPIPEFSYTTQTLPEEFKAVKDYSDYLPLNLPYQSKQRANVKVGFAPFETTVVQVDVVNGQLGSIDLKITGGKAPYQIFWGADKYMTEVQFDTDRQTKIDLFKETGIDTITLDSLTYLNYKASFKTTSKANAKPGKYRVFIYDNEGALTYKEIGISSNFVVEKNVGLDINGLQVSKSAGIDGWDDYFTSSSIGGPKDNAWYKIKVDNDASLFVTGFKDLDIVSKVMPYDDIAYGFKVQNNSLSIVEGEIETAIGSVFKGDFLSIEKQGSIIKYFKNGILLREVSGADKIYQLKGHVFTKTPAFLIQLKPFLLTPNIRKVKITHLVCGQLNTGAVELNIKSPPFGGPLSIVWSGLKDPVYTENISGLEPGVYTVTASNNFGSTSQEIWVGYKTVWENKYDLLCQPSPNENSLYPAIGGVWGSSKSNNILKQDNPGWQQYELNNTGDGYDMGLVEVSFSNANGDFGKVFSITDVNNTISQGAFLESQGTNSWTSFFMQEDFNAFRIQRDINNVISYTGLSDINSSTYTEVIGSYPVIGDIFVNVKVYSYDANGTEKIIELNNTISSFPCVIPPQYVELLRKLDGNYYIAEKGNLFIKYQEKYNYGDLDYKIYDKEGNIVLDPQQFIASKHFGANWYKWDLNEFQNFVYEEFYILEIKNDKNQLEYLRFKFWEVAP